MVLGMPVAEINSIGAGGGTYVFLDRLTNRLQIGPGSAEAVPGPICYDQGGEIPTITDCDLILGYIDPEYFLGGTSKLKINKEKATRLLKERVADPLKMDVAEVARGAKELLDNRMRDSIIGMVMSRGYNLSEYYLLGFGGAGPTHIAGYTEGLQLKGTMIFPYSAVFSAFGAATANFQHNYFKATNIIVSPTRNDAIIKRICQQLNEGWQSLENSAHTQMEREGFQKSQIQLQQLVMIRYGRQLDDLIVPAPKPRLNSAHDWDELIAAFERMYERIYAASAKYPQSGYEILQMGLIATVEKIKPSLKRFPLEGETPPKKAVKGRRNCYFDKWAETTIYDWDELRAGNSFPGPAIIEGPSSNLVLPPERTIRIDEYLTVWLS
jgi:N-methylhydantoinase A